MDQYVRECQNKETKDNECDIDTLLTENSIPDVSSKMALLNKNFEESYSFNTQVLSHTQIQQRFDQVLSVSKQKQNDCFQMLEACKHSSKTLINLINDLLDHAKQEKQTFQFFKQYSNLANIVENSIGTLQFLSSQKNIQTEFIINPKHMKYFEKVYCDDKRLE